MAATHAQIAKLLVAKLPDGVFAVGARDAAVHRKFETLEKMLPGVRFDSRAVGPDQWELVGVCTDGSTVVWRVGA